CPGQSAEIHLHDTEIDKSYFLWRTYEDDSEEETDFFLGTGGDYTYRISTPGTYHFDFPNSDFTVKYYEAFSYEYPASEEVALIDANGGIYRIFMEAYLDAAGQRHPINSISDLAFLKEPFAVYNSGGSINWNPHIRISYGFAAEGIDQGYIQITCPPNLSSTSIYNHSELRISDSIVFSVDQSGGGSVVACPVSYRYNKSSSNVEAWISTSQPDVVYTLYRDGIEQETVLGNGETITLYAPKATGYYHVTAAYEENGIRDEKELDGARLIGDCMAILPVNRNWIFTQTHNSGDKHAYDLTYYDGLGYAEQEVGIRAVANGTADLVRPIVYDLHHRETHKYLPFARTNGNGEYDPAAIVHQEEFYRNKFDLGSITPYAYVLEEYEPSPVGRVLESRKPGSEFQTTERSVRNNYFANDASAVLRLDVDAVSQNLKVNGFYAENMLSGVKTVDEDGAVSIVYTDKEGHTVYEERQLRGEGDVVDRIVTRYVYDDCGRLSWVVTPEGVDRLTQGASYAATSDLARNYCYFYRYDEYGRQIEKQMPGREPEYLVYDRRDRLMMSQDGNMRTKKQWMIYRYDDLSRLTLQSLATDTSTDQALRHKEFCDAFNSLNPPALYTGPSTTVQKYAYDHYGWFNDPALAFEHVDGLTRENGTSLQDSEVRGYKTYEQLAVLTADDIQDYHDRAFYYDYKGRVIQTVEKDSRGNILRTTSRYDLIGNLLAQRESYTHGGTTDVLDRTFEYDSRSRMTKETAQFNDGEQAVVAYTYDDLGQLTGKTYGTGAHAIHETMDYNMQGWLTEKSSELFEMRLDYFETYRDWLMPSYTGNIVTWWWQHKNIDGSTNGDEYAYGYCYDDLSRLTAAQQFWSDSEGPEDSFTEKGITYDKNSNILTLNRSSLSSEDARSYQFSYNGNQRVKETNSNSLYGYDANGNISGDALSGLEISYNLLNLPSKMYGWGDYSDYYRYLADGTKILHEYSDGQQDEYRGSLVYYSNGEFSVPFGGGRLVSEGNTTEAHYFLTDHLGSTRVVAKVTPTGRIDLDRKDYYPFGKEWTQSGMPTSSNRYMFSGKERQDIESDDCVTTPLYDFGARFYDPDGVCFLQQDPLMEKYYSIGQYNYCVGNPIKFADHDGRKIVDAKGRVLYQNGQWTKEASGTDAMRVGIAMMATPTGQATFDTIVNSSTNIQIELSQTIKLSDDGSSLIRGEMVPGNIALSDNGQVELLDGKITIFEGSLKAEINGVIGVSDKTSTLIKSLPENIALDGAIGSVAVHEGIHTTKENIQQQYDNIQKNETNDIEKDPINAQN
ncbi:RHS repeat domain-containing protein, partial [Alistipes communis]|uniref:RHS repeat domain-containing protein n=1 Tax=Alistipes communis TaxID=2585118 RepID=UPI003AF71331